MVTLQTIKNRFKAADFNAIITAGAEYTDPQFPAAPATLGAVSGVTGWTRAKTHYKAVYDIFKGIDVSDIRQGSLGDCYLLSAISATAEYPNRIQRLFLTQTSNPAGCYALNLYVAGYLSTIVLDDFFPYSTDKWAFNCSTDAEIWVNLIEKAWGKIHENFTKIEGGDSRETLGALTGAPTDQYQHKEVAKDVLWKTLSEADKSSYIMCCGGAQATSGLASGHAYSLIQAVEVETAPGTIVKLVKVRNPWGNGEWTGDWSDSAAQWTPALREKLNHYPKDDGSFYMDFDTYLSMFSYSTVCRCIDSYLYSQVSVEAKKACVTFQLKEETKGYFTANQLTTRLAGTASVQILVLELYNYTNGSLSIFGDPVGCDGLGFARKDLTLAPGLYMLYAYYQDATAPIDYLCFSAYANKAVDFVVMTGKDSVGGVSFADMTAALEADAAKRKVAPVSQIVNFASARHCPNYHPLEFKAAGEGNIRCDLCRKMRLLKNGFYVCEKCRYDVCTCCIAPPADFKAASSKNPIMAKKEIVNCNKGHPLAHPTEPVKPNFTCTYCGVYNKWSADIWACKPCGYLVCTACKPVEGPIAPPPKVEITKCSRDHPIKFVTSPYPQNSYACDVCNRIGQCTSGRWFCEKCNFDVCTICKAPEKKVESPIGLFEPVICSSLTCCKDKHLLNFSTFISDPMPFKCKKCEKEGKLGEGRWTCLACNYNICQTCRPGAPDKIPKDAKTCPINHLLVKTSQEFMEGSSFRCKGCTKSFPNSAGCYWCFLCKYGLCIPCFENMKAQCSKEVKKMAPGARLMMRLAENNFLCEAHKALPPELQGKLNCAKCAILLAQACVKQVTKSYKAHMEVEFAKKLKGFENQKIKPSSGEKVGLEESKK